MPSPNFDAVALDQRHVLRPWLHFESARTEGALVIETGEGAWLTDTKGRRYLDAVGGLWCTNVGLGRAEVADAMADQARALAFSNTFTDMTNGVSTRLAVKLAELAPGDLNRVHFTTGGSTANDSAYRLMQYYHHCKGRPEKTHVIARMQSYHGSSHLTMSIGNRGGDRMPEFKFLEDGFHHISAPDLYRRPDGLSEADYSALLVAEFAAKVAEIGPDRVGAFFAEPIMGSGGVLVPPEGYLQGIRALCAEHDILFVADEVVTAWGRVGHWFASYDLYGITPDIITTAKGLTSGYIPMGAMIYSDRIHEAIKESGWYASGYTYAGHPVAAAAALKVIEIMEREDLPARAREVGAYFEDRLQTLRDLPTVGDVRGKRMMMCVENVADKATRALHPEEIDIGKRISLKAEELGLIVRPMGHLNVMSPPLTITRDEVDLIVERLGAAISAVSSEL